MKWVPKALQFPIIIERCRAPAVFEAQPFKKFDFFWGHLSAQRTVFQKRPQARLLNRCQSSFPLDKFKPLQSAWSNSGIQSDLQTERPKIDIPRYDQRIEESDAAFRRCVENV